MNNSKYDKELWHEDVKIKEYEFIKGFKNIKCGDKAKNLSIFIDVLGNKHYTFSVNNMLYSLGEEEFLKIVL